VFGDRLRGLTSFSEVPNTFSILKPAYQSFPMMVSSMVSKYCIQTLKGFNSSGISFPKLSLFLAAKISDRGGGGGKILWAISLPLHALQHSSGLNFILINVY